MPINGESLHSGTLREIGSPDELRRIVRENRDRGRSVGLVPTMGYLHRGHLRLAEEARGQNDLVVMSIFVNPTQFGPNEDLERYPRDLERDRSLARQAGVDFLFMPDVSAMYPSGADGQLIWVDPGPLASSLCGASRPAHFRGVVTVVSKLLNMALPDRAYFGQKDAQQAIIVSRMVRDLAFPVEICVVPTVREPDGLALSSRNVYLSPEERKQATALSGALRLARTMIESGEMNAQRLEQDVRAYIGQHAPSGRIDYVTVADLETLQPVQGDIPGQALLALAVYFGTTRLIDNLIVQFVNGAPQFS